MGNLFKVKSNKMSRLGFHPDLLSASRAVPRPLGAASATLCSIFGSKDAMLAHPTLDIMFFFVMHIRTGPLEVQYLCEAMGLRGGLMAAWERTGVWTGISSALWDCARGRWRGDASLVVPASSTFPGWLVVQKDQMASVFVS